MTDIVNVKIMPDDTKTIMGRQVASLGFAIGASILVVLIQRKVSDPDFILTCRMRTLDYVARYSDKRVHFWQTISAGATRLYLESRP